MNAGFLALTDGDYTAASAAFEKAWYVNVVPCHMWLRS